ncbi:MAG: peptidase vanX D-ala-D-ala dipeptidase [Sphingomonas bacterium]|uniref:M15 family metallopeptidase n=1 Tax=Sphingomonas bacterium TaxID=1895847 RepID=UPI00261AF22A|nr:M15 family metallopeptidase [Sphingomonas bacterium]MDB5708484.1 peptidase vanX D-ala-D-ala dipeptidase [Sphingomonas bacterium]
MKRLRAAILLVMAAVPATASPRHVPDLALVGSYGATENEAMILERDGALYLARGGAPAVRLIAAGTHRYRADTSIVIVARDGIVVDGRPFPRHDFGAETEATMRAAVRRDGAALRAAALAASPPAEPATRRTADLVALKGVVPHVRVDTRYATANNFTGQPIYERTGAYLQRPAAMALARVAARLASRGFGLVIYDGYRPWFATKLFWDVVPPDKHVFVADPAKGSRHNRGCAIDLGLYDLRSGKIVSMPSRYDEMSARAYPDFAGGTDAERAHRALLRAAMEREGFTVYEAEWWHFDYRDWADYPIGTISFTAIEQAKR